MSTLSSTFGSQDGICYFVMEPWRGETLADRLGKGPVSLEEALRVGTQRYVSFGESALQRRDALRAEAQQHHAHQEWHQT
jgi:hypothetical protein